MCKIIEDIQILVRWSEGVSVLPYTGSDKKKPKVWHISYPDDKFTASNLIKIVICDYYYIFMLRIGIIYGIRRDHGLDED